jgi:hypothetical protein
MAPHGTCDDESVAALLDRMRGEIEHTLAAYRLDEAEAEGVLQELISMLVYLWDKIGNRELWLIAALRRGCLRQLQERRTAPASDPAR